MGQRLTTVIKEKMWKIKNSAGDVEQMLPETSADQVSIADAAGKYTATDVEGALSEIATSISDLESGLASAGKVDDVQDVNGASIVTNKIAKLSKAAVGLGNVDNTADAEKNVKHATEAGKATNDSAGNKITDTYATKNELSEGLAGRATTKTYADYQAFVAAIGALQKSGLKVGDNVYIKTLDVPDMWVTAVNETSTAYTYTNDQAIINALDTTSGLTVGYFSFSKLETEKVNLSAYQTKTDNTLETTSKTVVGAINEVKGTADGASSKASANATEISNIKDGTTVVKKASHANAADNATNVTTNINGKAIADIFETDGKTAKEATHAMSADSSTVAETANKVKNPLKFAGNTDDGTLKNLDFNGSAQKMVRFKQTDFSCTTNNVDLMTYELSTVYTNTEKTQTVAGEYTAIKVDEKGRATAGGKAFAFIEAGAAIPEDVMIGGIVFEAKA